MKNYVDYRDNGDTEERVQVTQAFCNSEEEIEEAIERSKRDLKNIEMPYGYQKLDEEIITTVYKVPDYNEFQNRYENKKIYKNSYNEYENNQREYTNYKNNNDGRIQNFTENEISKDGQYLISMTLSKKIMDEKNNQRQNVYRNNYYKEAIEVDENDENQKYNENNQFQTNNDYQVRNQQIYGNKNFISEEEINKNKYYPIRSERKVIRYYTDEDYSDNYNDERGNRDFKNVMNSQTQHMQFPSKYNRNEFNNYGY